MFYNFKFIILMVFCEYFCTSLAAVKVCKSYGDYLLPFSKNCWLNRYDEMNVTQIAQSLGLQTEEHHVTTRDGYVLFVLRILSSDSTRTPLVFGHALPGNAKIALIYGNESLAYQLNQKGHEIWLPSYRGVLYSRKHISLAPTDINFWKFSFYEMGAKDLPSIMDLIHNTTNKKAIYVSFGAGASIGYVYCTVLSDDCGQKLKGITAVAPWAFEVGIRGVSGFFANPIVWPIIRKFTLLVDHGEFLKVTWLNQLKRNLWGSSFPGLVFFSLFYGSIFGFDFKNNPTLFPILISNYQDGYGVDCFTHYVQIRQSHKFRGYDFGKKVNKQKYGQDQPLEYHLNKIPVTVAMVSGSEDFIASVKDAEMAYSTLNDNVKCGQVVIPGYNHQNLLGNLSIVQTKIQDVDNKNCENSVSE